MIISLTLCCAYAAGDATTYPTLPPAQRLFVTEQNNMLLLLLHCCGLRTPTGEVFRCMPLGALALPLSLTPTYLRGTHVPCYILELRSTHYCIICTNVSKWQEAQIVLVMSEQDRAL